VPSKRLRYEVFRRDNYTCRYCGAKPPEVKLVPDHVVPKALGGSETDPANFVAACEACNSGKTSTSPDAPLVADVAEDALKWATAIKRAQAAMVADIEARAADRAQFQEWWDGWGYGTDADRKLIPKDPGWQVTVDQFITAGLSLPVLRDCIELAMTRRKVQDENKFKYMCGIAWSKVTEMQKAAGRIASGEPFAAGTAPAVDEFGEGRLSLARELLAELSDEERAHFLDSADMTEWQNEDDDPQTESQQACEAVSYLLNSARCNVDWLVDHIRKTLGNLPPEIGKLCLAEMAEDTGMRDPISRLAWQGITGLWALQDLIDLPAAKVWAAELTEAERMEWLEYAHALQPNAQISDERWLTRAWEAATVTAGGAYYLDMCSARGEHISNCPVRIAYWARIPEMECCGPDRAEDHKGHRVCERHLEHLMDGTFTSRGGQKFTVADFTEVEAPEDARAPL
jgi:HNH endonuclease